MTLTTFVYVASVLDAYRLTAGIFMAVILMIIIGSFIYYSIEFIENNIYGNKSFNESKSAKGKQVLLNIKRLIISLVVLSVSLVFVPSKETSYTMLAAYAAQQVAENPKAEQISGKVLEIINNKLDEQLSKKK